MEIKAADVAKLRKMTGAGMMDCKKALVEANGDYERAQEIIREKGKLVAAKRADRETTEGVVIAQVSDDKKTGVVVGIGCETDFVSKNTDFQNFAKAVADAALANLPADDAALNALTIDGETIENLTTQQTGKTGEKTQVSFYGKLQGEFLSSYIHMNGKLGTVVAFSKVIDADAAREIAMQIAAMSPVSISADDCPADVKERELRIGREKAIQEGKPENIVEKIAEGSLNKFFKEYTLLNQAFIKDAKLTVEAYLKSVDADVKVTGFVRFSLSD